MTDDIAAYINQLELGQPLVVLSAEQLPGLSGTGTEAAVVASNLVSYHEAIPEESRAHVANWMLLAQIVATSKVPDKDKVEQWMDEYNKVLLNTGWAAPLGIQTFTSEKIVGATVHREIIKLLPLILGPAAGTALALVTAALTSLDAIDKGPWITLFDRRGKDAKAVGFQVLAALPGAAGAVALDGGDFSIRVSRTMTQVLFFTFENNDASVYKRQAKYELSQQAMNDYGPAIKAKVDAWIKESIAAYDIPAPPSTS